MISYFVKYDGQPENTSAFLQHYRNDHAKILNHLDGIEGLILHTPVEWLDPYPVNKGSVSLLAQMKFESIEALNQGLTSEARKNARLDFEAFPKFSGQIIHQAFKREHIF